MALSLEKLLQLAQFAEKDHSLIQNHITHGVFKELNQVKNDLEMFLELHKDQKNDSGDELFTGPELVKIQRELKQVESAITFYTDNASKGKETIRVA